MKKNVFFLMALLCLFFKETYSQVPTTWNCGTTEPPNDFLAEKLKRGELKTFAVSPKIIWVYFHNSYCHLNSFYK